MTDISSKRPSRRHPRWIHACAWVNLLVSPFMFLLLVMPIPCHSLDVKASLNAESVQAWNHGARASVPDGHLACDLYAAGGYFDDRDLDLAVVEVEAALDFPAPAILPSHLLQALTPAALAIRRGPDRRALPSLALYERTARLRN